MRIWNGVATYPDADPVVASIGNYDGVHLGHQAILERVIDAAQAKGSRSLLITFAPHPLEVVAPERRPRLLHNRRQKLERLEQTGLTDLLLIDFTEEMAALSGEQFFEQVLADRVRFSEIHVGESFRFGRDRSGDVSVLSEIGTRRGFAVQGIPAVQVDGTTVSSTAIRRALLAGNVETARKMLGNPYSVAGEVVHGDGRGRSIQFPTANIELENELVPAAGVYITETSALASRFASVTNVGVRPTFGGDHLIVETHLLDFDEDLYDERLKVRFLARLRKEAQFANVGELADQIARDCAAAQAFFDNQRLNTV